MTSLAFILRMQTSLYECRAGLGDFTNPFSTFLAGAAEDVEVNGRRKCENLERLLHGMQ